MSVLDTLQAASPMRRTYTTCVEGALQAEWDDLNESLDEIAANDSLAMEKTRDAFTRMDQLRDRVKASQVTFVFERIPWPKRIALQAGYPPREGNIPDKVMGFNIETFYPVLIKESCTSVQGVDGDPVAEIPDEAWVGLLGNAERPGSLNFGQVNRMIGLVDKVNGGDPVVPPSARSLLGSQASGASLAQPDPGKDLPPSGSSTDGNPPTSPKSSTTPRKKTTRRTTKSTQARSAAT